MSNYILPPRLIKLDKRWSHSHLFPYILQYYDPKSLHNALIHCYDNWGMTVDVETYSRLLGSSMAVPYEFQFSPEWSYLSKYGDHRIYLSKAAAAWFKLQMT